MIIGLTGYASSGKTTIANHLVQHHGFTRIPFAGPLKAMTAAFGLGPEEMAGALKETPLEVLCGKTPRQFMQMLGTEFGRQMIGQDVWVKAWQRQAREVMADGFLPIRIVVDDARFPNEADVIRSMGGVVIHLVREGAGSLTGATHESERPDILNGIAVRNDSVVGVVAGRVMDLARGGA